MADALLTATVSRWLLVYLACLGALLAVDLVWLAIMVPNVYEPELGDLFREDPNLVVAALFYLLYVVGVVLLAVRPGSRERRVADAAWRGALLGACAYGTYDITNLATLEGWSATITVIDIAWGALLTAFVASVGGLAVRWLRLSAAREVAR